MSSVVGAYEAKTHLPSLLEQAERGEVVTITRHGRPVARLVPVRDVESDPGAVVAALLEARKGVRLGRLSLRRMIEEGRR